MSNRKDQLFTDKNSSITKYLKAIFLNSVIIALITRWHSYRKERSEDGVKWQLLFDYFYKGNGIWVTGIDNYKPTRRLKLGFAFLWQGQVGFIWLKLRFMKKNQEKEWEGEWDLGYWDRLDNHKQKWQWDWDLLTFYKESGILVSGIDNHESKIRMGLRFVYFQ